MPKKFRIDRDYGINMVQWSRTTTADVLISFQQNPGADNDSIIDAGVARNVTMGKDVQPVSGGYYGLSMNTGEYRQLLIFGTPYNVHLKAQDAVEAADRDKIISWDDFRESSKNKKVQYCLQLLGYYRGQIDGILARQTEEALLGFQADNKIPT
ncbi:MAG: peptidoglycan-binding protein, partial [Candidatus Zixiibacteriota bacterium]